MLHKTFIRSSWVWAYEPETTQQSTLWDFEDEPNPTKIVCGRNIRNRWSPVSSAKLLMWRLFHLSIVGWLILSGISQFVCLESSEKFEKTNKTTWQDNRLKPAKASNWWLICRTALTWHSMTSFYSSISRKQYVVDDFRWSVQIQCFEGVSIGVHKVLRQVVWAHKSCCRMRYIRIFIITPEIYRASLVLKLFSLNYVC